MSSDPTGGPGGDPRPALRRCLSVDVQAFAERYWGQAPLLSKAADLPGALTGLLTVDDVDELLSVRGLRTPFLRIARNGELVDPARFTGSMGAGAGSRDQVRSGSVLSLVLDGATVVLQGLHRLWPPLIDLGDQLALDLGHAVQVNAYVTPPGARGFDAHYDTHDVLVVQTVGEKHWRVHAPVVELPGPGDPWTDHRARVAEAAAGEPVLDVVLQPGDVLYLPRGYLHSATATAATSVHLTIGIHPTTGVQAADQVLQLLGRVAAADPVLRRALPLGVDLCQPATGSVVEVITRLRDLLDGLDPVVATDRLRATAWEAVRPAPVRPFGQAAAVAALSQDDVLTVRRGLRTALRDTADGTVLLAGQGRFDHDLSAAPALGAWLAAGELKIADLPGLDKQARLDLARRLVGDGCAVIVPHGSA